MSKEFEKYIDGMSEEKRKRIDELATKVYQLVNDRYTVPDISIMILGESDDSRVGGKGFFEICDAVDKLINEGNVYFRDSDGVLLDLLK